MTPISERQHARFIYTKRKFSKRLYIFKRKDSLQKARQFALRFYSKEARHITLRDLS